MADYRYFRGLSGRREMHHIRAVSADHGGFLLKDLPIGEDDDRYHNDEALERLLAWEVEEYVEFLDPYVRGRGEPFPASRRAKWHLGHVGWQESVDWPPPGVEGRRLYLAAGGNAGGGGGALSVRPESERTVVSWVHDPLHPVPSPTDGDDAWLILRHYPDMAYLAERDDVLTFTTDPLDEPLDIVGTPYAMVAVGSSAKSMHIYARMQDLAPDGRANPISSWQAVVHSPDPDRFVQVDLSPISYRVRPGHRLRLQLASSDFPYYLVHPGTEENPWFASEYVANEQSLVTVVRAVAGSSPVAHLKPEARSTSGFSHIGRYLGSTSPEVGRDTEAGHAPGSTHPSTGLFRACGLPPLRWTRGVSCLQSC
jgi:putative CocE/NonD family hydrolase